MKKQRILALALTATMAMSVFGGMSASAVDKDEVDGFQTYTKPVTGAAISGLDLSKVYYGTYEDAMVDGFENGTVYLFDLLLKSRRLSPTMRSLRRSSWLWLLTKPPLVVSMMMLLQR